MSNDAAPKLPANRFAKASRLNRGWCLDSYLKIVRFARVSSRVYGPLGGTKLAKTASAHLIAVATVTGGSGQGRSLE